MPFISEDGLKFLRLIADVDRDSVDKAPALAMMALIETVDKTFCCPVCGGPLEANSSDDEKVYFTCRGMGDEECADFEMTIMKDNPSVKDLVTDDETRFEIWPELRVTREDRRDYYETERLEERRAA